MTFVEHLKKYLSDEEITLLLDSLNKDNKHAVLLNLRKMDDEMFLSLYPNCIKHQIVDHAYLYDKNEYDLGKSIYHDLGCFYLQEPSAMIPSFLLSPKKGEVVLDLCAAPGGKSVQASFLMENEGLIISNDISRSRANAILENVERLGIGNTIITCNDFSSIYQEFNNTFDKIILDAPCSGSGMFRKDIKMREDWSYNKVLKFASLQKELILMAYQMLKEGGSMVYSTCSFSYEEDEEVIEYLLDNTDAELIDIPLHPSFYASKNKGYGIHTFPYLFDGEGHYICLIKKPGILQKSKEFNNIKIKQNEDIYLSNKLHHFDEFGDALFALPMNIKLPKKLSIIRKGVKILEWNKSIYRYDYHYSHFLDDFNNKIGIDEDNLNKYIKGYELNLACARGHILLLYKGIPVSFGKSTSQVIKNYYPKSLRR